MMETVVKLVCKDCGWNTETIDNDETIKHIVFDHIGNEQAPSHTVEATVIRRYTNEYFITGR